MSLEQATYQEINDTVEKANLMGTKKMTLDNIIKVKGKRDISPILVALDLIGGGK